MAKKLVPLFDYIIFEMQQPDKTAGGLFVPENSSMQRQLVVVSVGPDVKGVKVGDSVVISAEAITAGTHITGKRQELVREKDLCALLVTEEDAPVIS